MCASRDNRAMIAVGLIGIGVMFFMGIGLLWPMFILVPGLIMLGIALGGRVGAAALAIPGMLVSGTGALLFMTNVTGYWESWSYIWTLYGVFLGMGFMLMGQKFGEPSLQGIGRAFVYAGLAGCAAFVFFFEIIIGISGGPGPVGALLLIGAGLYLLSRDDTGQHLMAAFRSDAKSKRKPKAKHDEKLFTGPVVYGTRVKSRDTSRLTQTGPDDGPG